MDCRTETVAEVEELREARICVQGLLAKHLGETVVGDLVRGITQMLWDTLGQMRVLRVVIEGCGSAEWRERLAGRVHGFDGVAGDW